MSECLIPPLWLAAAFFVGWILAAYITGGEA